MEGFPNPSDADRELDELRLRAYGPHPDIGVDPAALARLRELEAAHRPDAERRADVPTSYSRAGSEEAPSPSSASKNTASRTLWQRATETWWSRLAWAAGALVIVGGIIAAVLLVATPRAATTLRPAATVTLNQTATEADELVRRMLKAGASWLEIDPSTLRSHGSYLGLEIWSGVNAFHSPCLVAVHRANKNLSDSRCAPIPADLIMDVSSFGDGFDGFDGMAGVGIIRFILRGDTVDGYVYLVPETG